MRIKSFFMNRLFWSSFVIAIFSLAITTSVLAMGGKFCSKTTNNAFIACGFEVKDDFWIARGNCNNLSDAEERRECTEETWEERIEGMELCMDQREARQDVCDALGEDPYDPEIDPLDFVDDPLEIGGPVEPNEYFPLIPGTIWEYEGGDETITVTVTDETKEILGVNCIVVNDVVEEDGEVIEDTNDWYAQDLDGNVWYFGEIAMNYEDGELVDIEGSWTAGVDGAKPGIIMKADPEVGDVYRQEFFLGDAEDMGEVLMLDGTETVPAASCTGDCLVTKDYTPIEPDVEEHKYYAPDIGPILEVDMETGERVELVDFTTP
jgi:hypothetical protein